MTKRMVKSNVNCSIEASIKEGAKNLRLEFSKALEFGLQFKAAEINDNGYPNNLLSRRIEVMSERLSEANKRIEELEGGEKIGGKNKKEYNYPDNCYGN